jgi:4'-phosphopantetheinyl transferase
VPDDRLSAFQSTLSPDERERAERFVFGLHRNHYIAGRGILRAILASYLDLNPAKIQFAYTPRAKPFLADMPGAGAHHFNIAHSEGLVLVAISQVCEIGVDVERIRPMPDAHDIASHFFSPREKAQLNGLPTDQVPPAFFNLWTRKEACLKATGEGITELLPLTEVSFLPGEPAQLHSLWGDPKEAGQWTLEDLTPAPGYAAALAAPARDLQLHCWRWPTSSRL